MDLFSIGLHYETLAGDPSRGLVLLPVGGTYGSYRSSLIEDQYSPTEKETWVSQLDT